MTLSKAPNSSKFSWPKNFKKPLFQKIILIGFGALSLSIIIFLLWQLKLTQSRLLQSNSFLKTLGEQSHNQTLKIQEYKQRDEYQINIDLESEIDNIHKTYNQAVDVYESLLKLKDQFKDTGEYDQLFAKSLSQLATRDYSTASATLATLNKNIVDKQSELADSFSIPKSAVASNTPPESGYSTQRVSTPVGDFLIGIVAADLASTRVIVDTASDSDCHDNCPVLPLSDYVSRNGAFAGINGSYFCPASYPSCQGKTNSFDLLVMNKNKTYFNSDNNVYSTNPAVIFGGGWVRFVGRAQEWGRDTSVDGVLSNYPLLVSGSNNVFAGDSDPKKCRKSGRSFVASKGSKVYIGVVFNSTVAEAAHALTTLGMEHAINLDSGGSTALWYSGYKAGPGRNIPNAILFVRK